MVGGTPRAVGSAGAGHEPANLGDILERVLDKGIVIAGDIRVNLLDIELLTIKLRLVIASLETARDVGINWWESDPWLSGDQGRLAEENSELRRRIAELEGEPQHDAVSSGDSADERSGHQQHERDEGSA